MTTPLRRQYLDIKRRYPGMILLFQIGDFYETFDEDAQLVSRALGVTLTRKWFGKKDVHPLAGIPVRSVSGHLARLIQAGHKVALCDQITPPGKGLVEREVVRVITPGTVTDPALLEGRVNNYLASLAGDPGGGMVGLAYTDVTTGEFRVTELPAGDAIAELERLGPAELVVPKSLRPSALLAPDDPAVRLLAESPAPAMAADAAPEYGTGGGDRRFGTLTQLPDEQTGIEAARKTLLMHFGVLTLQAYGCEDRPLATRAAATIIAYLHGTQPDALKNLLQLTSYHADHYMQLDPQTVGNLEVFHSWDISGFSRAGSLCAKIDLSETPMGGRLLRRWLRHPLLDLQELRRRQDAVEWFHQHEDVRQRVRTALSEVQDIERLLGRVRRRLAVPAEMSALSQSLKVIAQVRAALERSGAPRDLHAPLCSCDDLVSGIERSINDRAPSDLSRGGIIRAGFSPELDTLRTTLSGGRRFLAEFEARERQRTGIRSLKVGYNKVFGFYIEVTRPNLHLVPQDYFRKQTLAHAERYFTLELKEHESLIANARERVVELETTLYRQVCDGLSAHHERIGKVAVALSQIDLYAALGECAARFRYVRPELHQGDGIDIVAGRHPTIEHALSDRPFQPNDTHLSGRDAQIILLTAPNMAGKSVYLRQIALICLMAQIGSFVPADSARMGLLDRIFTRIGLTDSTRRGHSSFMSEMVETAHILHHATPRSLIVLDEIGRGTATADGLSIARAVIEYLHNHPRICAPTLFATHYHELCACAADLPRLRNFHLAVREHEGKLTYLHRVEPGVAERSLGLHVAQLAGLPQPVLRRAAELLLEYERTVAPAPPQQQRDPVVPAWVRPLVEMDLNEISPIEALTKLYAVQRQAREWLGPATPSKGT